jgi:hypothetical protein
MLDELQSCIAAVEDRAAQPRLAACIPVLLEAVDAWGGPVPADRGGVTVACATPLGALLFHSTGWPAHPVEKMATATPENSERIRCALALLLGPAGVEAQQADAMRIAECGGWPLCVALFERQQGSVTVLVTTVTVQARTLH